MKKIITIFLLLISSSAFAAWTSSAISVLEIIAEGDDTASSFLVVLDTKVGSTEGGNCMDTYHYLDASSPKGKLMLSMLLTAKSLDKKLKFSLTDVGVSSTQCVVTGVRF